MCVAGKRHGKWATLSPPSTASDSQGPVQSGHGWPVTHQIHASQSRRNGQQLGHVRGLSRETPATEVSVWHMAWRGPFRTARPTKRPRVLRPTCRLLLQPEAHAPVLTWARPPERPSATHRPRLAGWDFPEAKSNAPGQTLRQGSLLPKAASLTHLDSCPELPPGCVATSKRRPPSWPAHAPRCRRPAEASGLALYGSAAAAGHASDRWWPCCHTRPGLPGPSPSPVTLRQPAWAETQVVGEPVPVAPLCPPPPDPGTCRWLPRLSRPLLSVPVPPGLLPALTVSHTK